MNDPYYGCEQCGEIVDQPLMLDTGKLICPHCAGSVLTVQEAFDRILELKSYIRELANDEDFDFSR